MPDASEIVLEIRMGTSSLVQPKAQEWTTPQCIPRSTAAGGKENTVEWINYVEQCRFREEQAAQRERFQKAGMEEEMIQSIERDDKKAFNRERNNAIHTQSLFGFNEGMEEDGRNPLLKKFKEAISVEMEPDYSNPFWWFDTLENEKLIAAISVLSDDEKMLITLLAINEYCLKDAGQYFGITKQGARHQKKILYQKVRDLMGGSI